jgi:hypothetical protein
MRGYQRGILCFQPDVAPVTIPLQRGKMNKLLLHKIHCLMQDNKEKGANLFGKLPCFLLAGSKGLEPSAQPGFPCRGEILTQKSYKVTHRIGCAVKRG